MNIVSILGLGSIGLGFLLAFLTYRLLTKEREQNLPIYVFQVFCFLLVLVGAALQYSTTNGNDQVVALQAEIARLQREKVASDTIMRKISDGIPTSISNLQAVNAILTGNVCEGESTGVPIWGGRGTDAAAQSTAVMNSLAAAKSSIEGVLN